MTQLPQIVIIDFSVAMHQLHYNLVTYGVEKAHYNGVIKAQMVYMMSLDWMGSLKPSEARVVLVKDIKKGRKYWRTSYLEQPQLLPDGTKTEPIHYKGGRKFPDKSFTKLKRDSEKIAVSQNWDIIGVPDYEADDLAASIVYLNNLSKTPRSIWTITVDSDWLGMVSDNTKWFCLKGYEPRVRHNLAAVNVWAMRRLNKSFAQPKDLWSYKAAYGDKSDNLPKNSPIEVIDLFNPPEQYKLWLRAGLKETLESYLTDTKVTKVPDVSKALEYLRQLGVQPFIRRYLENSLENA